MWPDPRVVRLVNENFIPVRVHPRDQPEDFKRFGERYGAQWTPTILELDPDGNERYRVEGFLPTDDLLAQLMLGLGHMAFKEGDFRNSERWFSDVAQRSPESEAAPEAVYWAGVSRYKASNDAKALAETARAFDTRYQSSSWAKKASVWKK